MKSAELPNAWQDLCVKKNVPPKRVSTVMDGETYCERHGITMFDLVTIPPNCPRSGEWFVIPSPFHGSDSGTNTHIRDDGRFWSCKRHDSGGDPIKWVAVLLGLVSCEDCQPGVPLASDVFKDCVAWLEREGICSKEPRSHGPVRPVGQDDPCNVSEAIEEVDEEIVSPTDLEYSDDVFVSVCDVRTKKNGDEIVNPRPGAIATYLLEKCRFLTFDDTDAVCYYDPADGLYHTNGEKRIGDAMEELIGDHLTSRIVNESVDHIRRRTRRKREDCIAPPELVPINDGVFNVLDDSIAPYSPDKPFFNRHDFSYDLELLTQETRAKWLVTSAFAPDDVRSIQELGGACLYRAPLYKTAFMILGEGDNGKSIFLAWLRETIGTSAVSALSLYQLAANRFGTAQLVDRCANIYADLGGGDLKYVGTFMAITGGDEVGAEHKGQPYFMYVPFAVLVFSTNKLPDVKDPPDQFYNRWNLIEMPYRFVDDPTEPFERQRDASFELEPINAEDRDWLGTWFIEGLKRLLKTGHFSESESAKNVKERWISKTDSLRAFVNTMVEASEGSSVTKNDFLEAYQAWCGQEGMSAYSERYIGLHLPRYVRTRTTQTRPRGWANISVKGLEARGMPEIEDEAITLGKFENEDDIGD